jgi:hypothetical protein
MSEIVLSKQTDLELTDQQREILRTTLFGMIDGLSESDKKSWRRFWTWIMKAGSGEMFSIETWTPRNSKFHRMHMVMETSVFKSQERIKSFEQFRIWLKIGAGFVDWMAGPKGGVVPVPRSISYKKCDENKMRQFHDDAVAFLRTEHAQHYLWPHLTPFMAEQSMEIILTSFERDK